MAKTVKKAQQLQKQGASILSTFEQTEVALVKQVEAQKALQDEISQEINAQQALLAQVTSATAENQTVLQNVRAFLGK